VKVQALERQVRSKWPDLPFHETRLVCAALAMYRTRLIDLFMREHVLMVWIMEGGRYLRVHNGLCYFYNVDGAFQVLRGVPPESTFGRVKQFLLEVEGMFRLLPKDWLVISCMSLHCTGVMSNLNS